MFLPFFYLMRERGLSPSIEQWMSLLRALEKGMAKSSLMEFYRLCRCLLLVTEADFDLFDEVFLEYFKASAGRAELPPPLPEEFSEWLSPAHIVADEVFFSPEHMEILARLEEAIMRLLAKVEEELAKGHGVGGNCAVCTGCGLCARGAGQGGGLFGGDGEGFSGLGEGQGGHEGNDAFQLRAKSAFDIAEARSFKDFREDKILDIRQFSLAFRKLRQHSSKSDLPETEFDVERTIDKTAENAGSLRLVYGRPRKNTIKLLVLFDSDGSMWQHAEVSNKLFQALDRANHFRDLKFYYFHNCVYDHLYTSPACVNGEWEETERVMRELGGDYRVIYIGDASMADSELFSVGGNVLLERSNRLPGAVWLRRLRQHYPKSVWLNPIMKTEWARLYGGKTIQEVRRIFPMYELTVNGLDASVKKLLAAR